MFQMTDPMNMAEFGLVADPPSNSTPITAWNEGLNLRAKDGSVQGVYDFIDSFTVSASYNGTTTDARPMAIAQWTPAGSNFLNIAYIIESQKGGEVGKGRVFVYNSNTQATVEITGATSFQIDRKYPPQVFVFNEVLVVNPATAAPQYISADATTSGVLVDFPGWLTYTSNGSTHSAFARIIRPYKNRLIAMNFADSRGTTVITDDRVYPVDLAWSTNIIAIGSLPTSGWTASTTNSAGDAFLTSTPGKILDGKQLGEEFIAYKSDSVVRVSEIQGNLILSFDSLLEDDGIYATGCVADIGNSEHLVVGSYGVYIHDGRGDKVDIAKESFQESMFNLVNPDHKDRAFVFQQTRDKEVWFCFSSRANTGNGCDLAFVYDYNSKKLHKRTLPNIQDLHETEINGELKIFAASPDDTSIQELSTSVYVADGFFTVIDKDFGAPLNTKGVSTIIVNSEENVKVVLEGTYFLKDSKTYSDEYLFDASEDFKIDTRVNGKYFSMRVKMDGSTNPKLTTMAFNVRIAGTR